MISKIVFIICIVEIVLGTFGFLPIFPLADAMDMLENNSEYLTEEEKNKYIKKEKIFTIVLKVIAVMFIICIVSIIILSILAAVLA